MDTTFLRRWQQHLEAKLLSEPLLNRVCIATMLKQVQLDPEKRIVPHLGGRTVTVGDVETIYVGSGILINLPICVPSEDRDVEGAQLDALIYVDILSEDNLALEGDTGTGLTAEGVLVMVWAILNLYLNQDVGSNPATIEPVLPIEDKNGAYGYRLPVKVRMAQNGPTKCAAPICVFEDGQCTISCETAGATIYYTTDESYPGPYAPNQADNANTSTVYAGPFAVASGTVVCVTAFIPNSTSTLGSDLWSFVAP